MFITNACVCEVLSGLEEIISLHSLWEVCFILFKRIVVTVVIVNFSSFTKIHLSPHPQQRNTKGRNIYKYVQRVCLKTIQSVYYLQEVKHYRHTVVFLFYV